MTRDTIATSRYDSAMRRQGKRTGSERGFWLYVPAAELLKTGMGLADPAPRYRVWGAPRGRIVVQLYKEK